MAIDTKDKRINVMNITCRTFTGITPTGSITQNDKENFAWLYFPFTPSEIVEEVANKIINLTSGITKSVDRVSEISKSIDRVSGITKSIELISRIDY